MPLTDNVEPLAVWAFALSLAFLLYMLFGYPLLLAVLARVRPAPAPRREYTPRTVSVLLPVHNGEAFLRRKLESLLALRYPRDLLDIVVISDGSTDATARIAADFASSGVRLLPLPQGGKAAALNAGMAATSGEIIFFTDVRQTLHSESLEALVSCFADPDVGAACGELFIQSGSTVEEANVGLYWRYEKWIRRQLDRVGTLLVVTGCIYALRRSLARPIPPDTLGDDAFLPSNVILEGYRIVFEPRARAYDFPTSLDTEFGRKVRTLAGLYQLVQRMPRIALPANPMWLHFFSYKLGRLLMPYALIVMAVASFALPSPWNALALAAQGAFYGVALADRWVPDSFRLKRLTAPVRTFVVLMAASLCAASVLFVPPGRLWKTTRVQPAGSA